MASNLKRFLRWLLGGVFVLLLAAVAIVVFGDLSQFRGRVETAAAQQLGREVTISGAMRLRPTLPLLISVDDVRVKNAPWATHGEFARVGQVRLSLSMRALLRGALALETIAVENFQINAEVRADGARSWTDAERSSIPSPLPDSIELRNGTVSFVDHSTETTRQVTIDSLDAYLEADLTDAALVAVVGGQELNARLIAGPLTTLTNSDAAWPVMLRVDGSSWSITADGERRSGGDWRAKLEAEVNDVGVVAELYGVEAPRVRSVTAQLTASVAGKVIDISDFVLSGDSIQISGAASFDRRGPRAAVTATLRVESVDLDAFARASTDSLNLLSEDALDEPLALLELVKEGVDADLDVELSALSFAGIEAGPVRFRATVKENSAHLAATAASLGGTVEFALDAVFAETGVRLQGTLGARDFDPAQLLPAASGVDSENAILELTFSTVGRTLRSGIENLDASLHIEQVVLNVAPAPAKGESITVRQASFSIHDGILEGLQANGFFRSVPVEVSMRGHRSLMTLLEDQPADVRLSAVIGGLELEMDGVVAHPMTAPAFSMALAWTTDELGALGPLVGLDSVSLFASQGAVELHADAAQWSIKSLNAVLGDSDFSGSFAISKQAGNQTLAGSLRADALHIEQLNRFVQAVGAGFDSAAVDDNKTELSVDVEIGKFLGGLDKVSALTTRLTLKEGFLRLEPLRAMWSGKPVAGLATFKTSGSQPGVHLELAGQDFEFGELLTNLTSTDALSGHAGTIAVELNAVGAEPLAWAKTAHGQLTVDQGTLLWSDGEQRYVLDHLKTVVVARADRSVTTKLSATYENQRVELEANLNSLAALQANEPLDFSFGVRGESFLIDAMGSMTQPLDGEGLRVDLTTEGDSLALAHARGWLPDWLDGPFKGGASLTVQTRQLNVRVLELALAQTDISGELSMPLAKDGAFKVTLHSKLVTVPDLFDGEEPGSVADENGYLITPLPLGNAVGESTSGHITWQIDTLRLAASVFREVQFDVAMDDGKLDVRNSGITDSTGGRYVIAITVDPAAVPSGTLRGSGDSYDLGWVLPDTGTGKPSWPVDFNIDLTGPGSSLDWFLGHANGEVHFIAGKTEGAEFERWDLNLLSMMLPSMGEPAKDQLSCVVINADVIDGVASADGLVAETQSMVIAGGGKLDLRSEKLGFLLTAKPRDASLTGVSVPLKIAGTLAQPEFAPASQELVLKAGSLLLGVANPIAFLGNYVFSKVNKGNRCESALKTAREQQGSAAPVEVESSDGLLEDGLFGFLGANRERVDSSNTAANQARE